jgi:phosphoribosylaminoimidazolecarboxamide formyltransferase/IMP cyclohydrolase
MTVPIRRALISVSDKTGLVDFARALHQRGVEIISTGGTHKALLAAGVPAADVSTVTGFPEIMDGRVKTLHPKIHGALLGIAGDAEHEAARREHGIGAIDLLVVNLYPFEATVANGASWGETIENIDIGGPAMIRAAAKNHDRVTVVVSADDYAGVLAEMTAGQGATTLGFRRQLAAKAYARTASYDAAIAQWFNAELALPTPDFFATGGKRLQVLRYGENPQQSAALYASPDRRPGIASATQLQGKELSYNNINDADAALDCLSEFAAAETPACVIVKHANPCGVALGATSRDAYDKALACDPVSAFGGILAFNRSLDAATSQAIVQLFTEVIIAPGLDEDAMAILSTKKNLRVLTLPALPDGRAAAVSVKSIIGGLLVQSRDNHRVDDMTLRVVTKRAPNPRELEDLKFAFRVAKHVKSNAIIYARDGATVGIGAGQMSRVDAARIAVRKSEDAARSAGLPHSLVRGSVVASDAFFPFADGLLQAAEAGATAVIQPGGSIKDDEVIRAADEAGLAMVFTGTRHFRH